MLEIYSPSRGERELAEYLSGQMRRLGFEAYIDEVGNCVGQWGGGEREIVLLGHMDTVPGFIPVQIKGDLIYGRGAVDAKGPLAALVTATAQLEPSKDKRILVIGAVEEEGATSKGAHHLLDKLSPEAVIIGEPSGWSNITLGYRGRLIVKYAFSQEVGHRAGNVRSACEKGVEFWSGLLAYMDECNMGRDGLFLTLDASLREINSSTDGFTERIEETIGIRVPLGLEMEELEAEIVELAKGGEVVLSGEEQPFKADKKTPLVRKFLRSIRRAGGEPKFKLKTGTSDMNVVGPVWNCPIVAYGPGDSRLDHAPGEHLSLREYHKSIGILAEVLREL